MITDFLAAGNLWCTSPGLLKQHSWQLFAIEDWASRFGMNAPDAGSRSIIGSPIHRMLRASATQLDTQRGLKRQAQVGIFVQIAPPLFHPVERSHPRHISHIFPQRNGVPLAIT